ncbi:hypothetical protein C3V43_08035 [Bacteroides heparinolyticus]|uniref:DUF6242 domain-containing protein n=1 Tax=Prevotella heparinolytica TaxID=28113 RepID=UPI000D034471|nr:DUF6242 domain-containing protein [Bacteroides heparinolyticus]AVM57711.1 hypothetical protein C3V43_08035 [Bacteroides heparinolyticus]
MRIKFLSVIVSFLVVSVALSSCLKSEDNYELSSDATIHAFGIDTIHGKYYKFTIDQINRVIYNRDSLPVGSDTIIDRILIDTMTVTGWITSGSPDTLFVRRDSVDLRPAMNNSGGMKFKVYAADGVTNREYTLKINVHLQDPDSLVWTDMQTKGGIFSDMVNEGEQKAVVLEGNLFVYTSATGAYKTSTSPDKYAWNKLHVSGLPSDAKLTSVVEYNGMLYMLTASKKVYISEDGAAWAENATLGNNVIVLIGGFSDRLSGILEIDGKKYFNISKDGKNWEVAAAGTASTLEEVPLGFPTENIISTLTQTGNGVEKVLLAGMPLADNKMTTPWFSLDGRGWAALTGASYNAYCPGISHPVIMHYGDMFYCFGGEMDAIYRSVEGLAWYKTKSKILLPREFKGKGAYSVVVEPTRDKTVASADKRDFIWVVFGGNGAKNEVWRGRLNRLGFEIQ